MSGKNGRAIKFGDLASAMKKVQEQLRLKAAAERRMAEQAKPQPQAQPLPGSLREMEEQMRKKAKRTEPRKTGAKKSTVRKAGKKTKAHGKIILRAPGLKAAYREHLAREGQGQAAESQASGGFVDPRKRGQEAFEKVRELVAKASPAIEPRPSQVSSKTRGAIMRRIDAGSRAYAAAPEPDLDKGFIVGFDFGTSSLKLAVRQPYRAGDPVVAMPVPAELRSGAHPYLWQTALWFNPADESFSPVAGPGYEVLEGFKGGIIGGTGGERVRADLPVTRSEAAAAFLTLQLAHFLGWYHETRPLGAAGGERPLSINIGIPVAAQDDHRAFSTFRRIVAAAKALLPHAKALTLPRVRQTYYAVDDDLPPGWELVPELTAAIAGYAASAASRSGSHVLVDVGASTLDIVAFNLLRGERIAVISAAVELLGSASLEIARTAEVTDEEFKRACDLQFDSVFFRQACNPARGGNGFSPTLRRQDVQLVTTGGGCASPVHAPFIATMTHPGVLGTLPIIRSEPPPHCVASKCDLPRLLLAYGLTRDVPELLELKLPSQVPTIPPKKPGPDPYIGPEQT